MKGPQCRYTNKLTRCSGEAVDPLGEVLLCEMHLARALELLRRRLPHLFLAKPRQPKVEA